ncbi:DUF2069 domain-containing protein [Lysobacter sp. SG-8]|uniref:DUF2069 domain-containing protein n=1 Tax=Marilutibacter penaei TaxID=2759900 RepID=A0A7W3U3U2_9GAMM|nr:DUF2069 domain-containing protein [Lysobacter penaei]MBB1088431.1 DUF2069 domain-containing protein [Lysobacter penaei]
MIASHRLLSVLLVALAAVYAAWFHDDRHAIAAMLFFVLPPLLMAWGAWYRGRLSVFWAGVFGLGWFCHGVMVAWAHPELRLFAWPVLLLAIAIITAASWPGLRGRFASRRPG